MGDANSSSASSSSLNPGLVVLLHASPLENVEGFADDEIPDVERDLERRDVFNTLVDSGVAVQLKTLPLTSDTLLEALSVARVVLLACHGILDKGLVIESSSEVGKADLLTDQSLRALLQKTKLRNLPRMVFVSACHSESIGRVLIDCGVDHVVAIANNERISNMMSRYFFHMFLESALKGDTVKNAIEYGMKQSETHPQLPPERRERQRRKFLYLSRADSRDALLERGDLIKGLATDLTEASDFFGFANNEIPRPLYGRQSLIRKIVGYLSQGVNRVVINQSESGLGSSAVVHTVCRYLGDRNIFASIHLCERFSVMQRLMKESPNTHGTLLVLDPAAWVEESEEETWFWREFNNAQIEYPSILVVAKKKGDLGRPHQLLNIEKLEKRYIDSFRSYLVDALRLPKSSLNSHSDGNPRRIIAWAKSVCLQQTYHIEQLKAAGKGNDDWGITLERIVQDCVTGGDIWSRRGRRNLQRCEIDWIRSLSLNYDTIEAFWNKWLSPTLLTLGFVEPFWTNRSILGFISENDTTNTALHGKPQGYFLIRCSERIPGSLTLSYVSGSGSIEKSSIKVNSDGSLRLQSSSSIINCADWNEAMRLFRKLKKVVVSYDGLESLDTKEAFTDIY